MTRVRNLAAALALALCTLFASLAHAQTFPELTGRVVDAANVIPDDVEARLNQKLEALETQSQRQLVVATIPDLQGYDIADYGYQLGRHWQLGDKERNDGALLIVAPNERKVRIEVGYGLEPVLTDGMTSIIIQQDILPKFKAKDMPGGIEAGTDAIITQLTLPVEEATKIAQQAKPPQKRNDGVNPIGVIFWLAMFFIFFIAPMLGRSRGRRYSSSSGLGNVILWSVLNGMANSGRHSSGGGGGGWSSGGGSDWGGGGGFSGGGGSFGGGGSSGSW